MPLYVLILLFFIIIMMVLQTSRKINRFFIFINPLPLRILDINIYLCNSMRANFPLVANKKWKYILVNSAFAKTASIEQ